MAAVIRVLTEHQVGGEIVDAYPTWNPGSLLATARSYAHAVRVLLRLPPGDVAHVHLSERGSFLREGLLVALAQRRGLVTVATIHGASFLPFARLRPRLAAGVLRQADAVTCLDQETLDFVRQHAPEACCALIPNPVFLAPDFIPADETQELVVFAGEIGLRKGADVLARAWQRVARERPAARCLMIGPVTDYVPPSMERLEIRAPVSPPEIEHILQQARAIVLPSRAEAMPMVLAEAMSLGRPVVSTPVGGVAEMVQAGGYLVDVGDEAGLAQRLTELLSDAGLARALGEKGREFCNSTRSVDVVDAQLRGLYSAAAAAY